MIKDLPLNLFYLAPLNVSIDSGVMSKICTKLKPIFYLENENFLFKSEFYLQEKKLLQYYSLDGLFSLTNENPKLIKLIHGCIEKVTK